MVSGGNFFGPHAEKIKKRRLIEVNRRHVWERKRFSTFSGSKSGKKGKVLPLSEIARNRKN